ncbi:MAG: hypothetical protein M3Q71_05270 [Chloroflexota bacterium]|nr:hypothetical protein [Chloroflexota bacterium]MDP9470065.1 hypothetical protein [Chloroflexota bacterium]
MDGLALLTEARAAGLVVREEGGRLVVEGPKWAETLAIRLVAAKEAVLAALGEAGPDETIDVWWDDANFASSVPISRLPPRECIAPRACSRLGPCERSLAHNPCLVKR